MKAALAARLHHLPRALAGLPPPPAAEATGRPQGGFCAIAIAETWQRLASSCAMTPRLGYAVAWVLTQGCASLAPLEVGVRGPAGVRVPAGGAQNLGHAARAVLRVWDDVVPVQQNWKNAFNMMSRAAILNTVAPYRLWCCPSPNCRAGLPHS